MSDSDLTTLEAVRRFLQKRPDDTSQDELLREAVARASEAIRTYTGREFTPDDGATRTVETTGAVEVWGGRRWSVVGPVDLRAVEAVDDGGTVLVADDYKLRPVNPRHGVYEWLWVPYRSRERELIVTGDWGFARVPDDVEHWCIVTVAIWLRREVTPFERTFDIDEQRLERPMSLPSSVLAGLDHYRRRGVA